MGLIPGVVWVHDLFCRDLGPEACHTSPWERSIQQFYDQSLGFSERSYAPHQLWPRLYREVSLSPVVLFSSAWAHSEFKRMTSSRLEAVDGGHYSGVLPVPAVGTPVYAQESEVFRMAYVAGVGIEGRAHKLFPALRALNCEWKLTWMVNPGEIIAAENLVREFGLPSSSIEFSILNSPENWSEIVSKSDVALHLQTSVFGHLAPYAQISLASGVPVILENSGQGEDFPEEIAFRIVAGSHESEQIQEILSHLQEHGRGSFSQLARSYIYDNFSPEEIAQQLSKLLLTYAPHLSYVMHRWDNLLGRAREALMNEVRSLVNGGADVGAKPYENVIAPALEDLF